MAEAFLHGSALNIAYLPTRALMDEAATRSHRPIDAATEDERAVSRFVTALQTAAHSEVRSQ